MSFSKPQVRLCIYPSVSWHTIPLKFSRWNIICCGQKEPINVQFFGLFECSNESLPIPHAIFETRRSGFIQVLHHSSVSWKITPQYFFSSNLIYFEQNSPSKRNFWTFEWLGEYSSNSTCHIWNHKSVYHSRMSWEMKHFMIWAKRVHQSVKFHTFDCSCEISPSLYFERLLLLKVYKISAKKIIEELYLVTLKSDAKFEEKLIYCFKNDKNFVDFNPSTQKSQKIALWSVSFVQSI